MPFNVPNPSLIELDEALAALTALALEQEDNEWALWEATLGEGDVPIGVHMLKAPPVTLANTPSSIALTSATTTSLGSSKL